MADHTIEAHFKVSAQTAVDGRQRAYEARVVELMTQAITGDPLGTYNHLEVPALARAIYKAVMAMPAALEKAKNELHL